MLIEKYKKPREIMGISGIIVKITNPTEDAWSYVKKEENGYVTSRVDDAGDMPEYVYDEYEIALEVARELASY